MAKVGIIGWGVVGQAVGEGFASRGSNKIFWCDKYKKGPYSQAKVISESEFIFICVPTPMFSDGSGIDLSVVEEVVATIAPKISDTDKILVIKSTVIPGTTASFKKKFPKVNFAMNPEFLTEADASRDFLHPDRIIIGALSQPVCERLVRLYRDLLGPQAKVFITDTNTAEMVKYMSNVFLATKVIFANEMYKLCTALGINYEEVRNMVAADKRVGESHLSVTTLRGFGGKCFPKDTVALLGFARRMGVDMPLLSAMWAENLKIRKIRDWEEIDGAVNHKKKKA
jgi:UDPglucose 6-dehydrogenase